MKCPKCGSREFRIDVTFQGTVCVSFKEDGEDFEVTDSEPTDSEWDDDSGVYCFECGHEGTVREFDGRQQEYEVEQIRHAAYREAARKARHEEGECEIDGSAKVSEGDDDGAYVQAWVWVTKEEAGIASEEEE